MTRIDLAPLYRSSVGFDRFGSLLDAALQSEKAQASYPPYDIEVTGENAYVITIAVAGFERSELDIKVDDGVLSVRGKKEKPEVERQYLHQGIAYRSFERKFNLADHVEVKGADLNSGLLKLQLVKEVPEALKPKSIPINVDGAVIEHDK